MEAVMNPRFRILFLFLVASVGIFFLASQAHTSKPIGKITSLKGEVILLSGRDIKKVRIGHPVFHSDWIQTMEGEVDVQFRDGSLLRVKQFSSTIIRERKETLSRFSGAKKTFRRITCFAGTLVVKMERAFNFDKERIANYLQSGNTVSGVRGTKIGVVGAKTTIDWEGEMPGNIQGPVSVGAVTEPTLSNLMQVPCAKALIDAYRNPIPANITKALVLAYKTMLANSFLPKEEIRNLEKHLKNLIGMMQALPSDLESRDSDEIRGLMETTKDQIHAIKSQIDQTHRSQLIQCYESLHVLNEDMVHLESAYTESVIGTTSGCFPAGTLVRIGDGGFKRIEDVTQGDVLMTYDIGNDLLKTRPVMEVYEFYNNHYFIINKKLKVTAGERFLTPEGWKRVKYLQKGDHILDGRKNEEVTSLNLVRGLVKVYNLHVADSHNFFVSPDETATYLVHNSGGGGGGGGK
jgi:hypothetical protein